MAFGVLGLVFAVVSAMPVSAQTLGTAEPVTMIFVGGELCVAVDKMRVTIFRDKEPKTVKWQVTVPGRYWEMRYQESSPNEPLKPEGQGDFFANSGPIDIGCDATSVTAEVPTVLTTSARPRWPYMIKVYECQDGVRGDLLCELDPVVDWGDG